MPLCHDQRQKLAANELSTGSRQSLITGWVSRAADFKGSHLRITNEAGLHITEARLNY
jgi:hypothetical protein